MIAFRLPSLGSDMDEGTLVQWQVKPGDAVHKGQVIAVVDTAKAAIDVECWDEGVVHALLVEPGTRLPVGAPLALLRAAGESAQEVDRQWAAAQAQPAARLRPPPPASAAVGPPAQMAPAPLPPGRVKASPAARRLAQAQGIDLTTVTGRGGVIGLRDLQDLVRQRQPATRSAAMRRVMAAAMLRSKREIPHYYLAEEIPFERAQAWLAQRNADLPPASRLLPAALLIKAVALALQRHPGFNGFWKDDAFIAGTGIHVGVAVSLRDGGLVSPALHDVDRKDGATLTQALLDLVRRTRAGSLRSSELADATITVTNLGDQGVGQVFGIIHPPQVALVGFGRIATRPWAFDDGRVAAIPVVSASLSADHRASDGHRGARLLAEIRDLLQGPEALDTAP